MCEHGMDSITAKQDVGELSVHLQVGVLLTTLACVVVSFSLHDLALVRCAQVLLCMCGCNFPCRID